MTGTAGILIFIVAIVLSIMLHEWGHLASARRFGIRADRFFLGFGPTLWSTRRGETEYGVKALPLGGFVQIKGMTPHDERLPPVAEHVLTPERVTADRRRAAERHGLTDPLEAGTFPETTWERLADELRGRGTPEELVERIVRRVRTTLPEDATLERARATVQEVLTTELPQPRRVGDLPHRLLEGDRGRFFHDQSAWKRAVVLVAGSAMHFVIAIVVLFLAFLAFPALTGDAEPVVAGVIEDTPAEEAGLQEGDELLAVDGRASDDYRELRGMIQARPDQETTLTLLRDGEEIEVTVVPEPQEDPATGDEVGIVGFYPVPDESVSVTAAARATFVGDFGVIPMTGATLQIMSQVFTPQGLAEIAQQATGAEERDAETGVVSLVGAAGLAGQTDAAGAAGPFVLILLIVSINVFIGIFNLVPLPPLDGGHLAVLAVERSVNLVKGLRGRPQDFTVDPRAVAAIAVPVIAVLLLLMVALVWLDITEPIRFPE